jgi:Flp pilus assembly protein TadD
MEEKMTTARQCCMLLLLAALAAPRPATAAPDERVAVLYRESYQLEAKGDAAGALGKMNEIRAATGATYFVVVRTAWLQHLAGSFVPAVASYREAARLEPKAVEPKLGLTLPLLAQKRWRELERACRDVLALDGGNALARARLAHAHYSAGNYPDAATTYRKLVAEYPSNLDHKTGLGWALLRMGRRAEARQLFEAALAVSPDNPNAKQGLAAL